MSILTQMDEALRVFDQYYVYEQIEGMERVRREMIPREAFREALANALAHRQWDVNAHIKISMFADCIEITSPGGLPTGMSEEDYLRGGLSIARNPILANILFRLRYIERFGTGVPRIMKEYDAVDVSPRFDIRDTSITVTLPVQGAEKTDSDERCVLNAIAKGAYMSRSEISTVTGFSKEKTLRLVNALIAKGLLNKSGSGRAVKYSRGATLARA
ncbi:ATP-binding protein [Alloscardovia venturai]|uniref:ATP-binding protein n=1 Tax=Alloscardovia venturai TaxID=1769421 RepID=A0ABW2Y875_9BIFI